ncbi:MAG: hypothetical protein QM664_05010, partial [Flavihumibacter sp.]
MNNRPMTDTRPQGDRGNYGNRVTPNPGTSARDNTPSRTYQPASRPDYSRPGSGAGYERQQQMNRQPALERNDLPRQRPQVTERQYQPQQQQRSFEGRQMPQMQRSAPAPVQRSAPSGGGGGGNRGGGVSRPSRH